MLAPTLWRSNRECGPNVPMPVLNPVRATPFRLVSDEGVQTVNSVVSSVMSCPNDSVGSLGVEVGDLTAAFAGYSALVSPFTLWMYTFFAWAHPTRQHFDSVRKERFGSISARLPLFWASTTPCSLGGLHRDVLDAPRLLGVSHC